MAKDIGSSALMDVWAHSGDKTEPDLDKKNSGWFAGEQPPAEFFNFLMNEYGAKINHIMSNGVPQWDTDTEYAIGALSMRLGIVYQALTVTTGDAPEYSPSDWAEFGASSGDVVAANNNSFTGDNTFAGSSVFNSGSGDKDFSINGDTLANVFFVDASTDRIGLGTNAPTTDMEMIKSVARPMDLQLRNNSTASGSTSTEFRVLNSSGAGDFGITGTGYDADSILLSNEVFIVSESSSRGMLFKNNAATGYIRFASTINGGGIAEMARFGSTGALLLGATSATGSSVGQVVIPNNSYGFAAKTSDGSGTIGFLLLDTVGRVHLNLNTFSLIFDNAEVGGTLGALSAILHVGLVAGGTTLGIPLYVVNP